MPLSDARTRISLASRKAFQVACFSLVLAGCGQTVTEVSAEALTAQISISASQPSVRPSGIIFLTAKKDQTRLTGGVWSVQGGATNGTITGDGTYYSPAVLPSSESVNISYVGGGGQATLALKLSNPLPSVLSVIPNRITTLSTPLLLTGSGFIRGSSILVNGTAIPTAFVDASHLAGIVTLTQEVNSTAQIAVANPNPGGSTSASLQVPVVFAPITITSSQASVVAGGAMVFTATRQGTALSGGNWTVGGGSANGSIDANGTYHAPAMVPSPNQISIAFTRNGASAAGSINITNPVPVATAVSPNSLTALSTPVTLTGSGFIRGSSILVNGTAIPTAFIDASHLAGIVTLTQEVNSTVQIAVANPNPGGSTSASLQVPAVFAPITITSSQASVAAGGAMVFTATRQGTALSGGNWTVGGGSANGSIDANGTYHAPVTVPSPNQISIAFTRNGASAAGSINITNPVPVATAVSPNSLTALSTPVTLTGSGFIRGSSILVNGTAIPTAFIDASHVAGSVVLATRTNQSVRLTVSNPNPGAMSSNPILVNAVFPAIAVPPSDVSSTPVSSLHTPSYFTEQSDEFVGPFPSWINVKTQFGAVGDGVADDTAAIQRAINSVTDDSASCVLWLPAGTYKITESLLFSHMRNFSFIGEDPGTTFISWAGHNGGKIVGTDGSTYFRISRITLEGNGSAQVGAHLTTIQRSTGDTYYSTFNELSDLHFHGSAKGITLAIDAETAIERVFFDNLPTAGLVTQDFNTLNIFIKDSLFKDCGTGVSDLIDNGAGSFIVNSSFFYHSQIADMSIGNTGLFTARHNTSVGSHQFFLSAEIYDNSSMVTLQNNTIIDPETTPFQFGNLGPFMLIDNVARLHDQSIPIIAGSWAPSSIKDVFSMGNIYTPNGGIVTPGINSFQGRVTSYDDSIAPVTSIPSVVIPDNVYVPPNYHRVIFEVVTKTGAAVQTAIDQAAASERVNGSSKPVVHLPRGIYPVMSTITFPAGSGIQLIGDDVATTILQWVGLGTGPVVSVPTSNVTIRYLHVVGPGQGIGDGVQIKVADQPNTQVIIDQSMLQNRNTYGVNFEGLEHATAELFSTYTSGTSTGVKVTGGPYRAAKEFTLGVTNHYTGSLQSEGNGTSFDVSAGGKYMVQDNWHDYGATSAQNFRLSGMGTVTEQGGGVYMNSRQAFEIDGFEGNVSLMGLQFSGGFLLAPQSQHTNILNLGLVGDTDTYLPSSIGNATVGNILNSKSGSHIPQGSTPDVLWMRGMLAQTRTEYPIALRPLTLGSSRIRLNRVLVESSSSALHLKPETLQSGLSYSIQSGPWMLKSRSVDSCVVASANLDENSYWWLIAAGDGDVEVVSKQSGMALEVQGSTNQSVVLEPLSGAYDQRWLVANQGDGTFTLKNRHAGTALVLPQAEGCIGLASISNPSTSVTVTAH